MTMFWRNLLPLFIVDICRALYITGHDTIHIIHQQEMISVNLNAVFCHKSGTMILQI